MKKINNRLNGHHLNSKFGQDGKMQQPHLSPVLGQIVIGMVLSDAAMYRVSKEAYIKFEQGVKQKDFLLHLFEQLKGYTFMQSPGVRCESANQIKSYGFKTFTHPTFTDVYNLFYLNGKKVISATLVSECLEAKGFAYGVMGDGSLHREGRVLTLHTQGFTFEENQSLSQALNLKFGLNSTVKIHKKEYGVIQFPAQDANKVHDLIHDHMIPSMMYKVPRKLSYNS